MNAARVSRLGERAFILAMVAFFLLPFLWLATAAYKPSRDMFSVPPTLFQPRWSSSRRCSACSTCEACLLAFLMRRVR